MSHSAKPDVKQNINRQAFSAQNVKYTLSEKGGIAYWKSHLFPHSAHHYARHLFVLNVD